MATSNETKTVVRARSASMSRRAASLFTRHVIDAPGGFTPLQVVEGLNLRNGVRVCMAPVQSREFYVRGTGYYLRTDLCPVRTARRTDRMYMANGAMYNDKRAALAAATAWMTKAIDTPFTYKSNAYALAGQPEEDAMANAPSNRRVIYGVYGDPGRRLARVDYVNAAKSQSQRRSRSYRGFTVTPSAQAQTAGATKWPPAQQDTRVERVPPKERQPRQPARKPAPVGAESGASVLGDVAKAAIGAATAFLDAGAPSASAGCAIGACASLHLLTAILMLWKFGRKAVPVILGALLMMCASDALHVSRRIDSYATPTWRVDDAGLAGLEQSRFPGYFDMAATFSLTRQIAFNATYFANRVGPCFVRPSTYVQPRLTGPSHSARYFPDTQDPSCPGICKYQFKDSYTCEPTDDRCEPMTKIHCPPGSYRVTADGLEKLEASAPPPLNLSAVDGAGSAVESYGVDGRRLRIWACGPRVRDVVVGGHAITLDCRAVIVTPLVRSPVTLLYTMSDVQQNATLRAPARLLLSIPGAVVCGPNVNCTPVMWDAEAHRFLRAYDVDVTLNVRLSPFARLDFAPYSTVLRCTDSYCPVSRDLHGFARATALGYTSHEVAIGEGAPAASAFQVRTFSWLVAAYTTVVLTGAVLILACGTKGGVMFTFAATVPLWMFMPNHALWRRVLLYVVYALLTITSAIIMLLVKRPRTLAMVVVLALAAIWCTLALAQCEGVHCRVAGSAISCNMSSRIRCGDWNTSRCGDGTNLGPPLERAPLLCVPRIDDFNALSPTVWRFCQLLRGCSVYRARRLATVVAIADVDYWYVGNRLVPAAAPSITPSVTLLLLVAMVSAANVGRFDFTSTVCGVTRWAAQCAACALAVITFALSRVNSVTATLGQAVLVGVIITHLFTCTGAAFCVPVRNSYTCDVDASCSYTQPDCEPGTIQAAPPCPYAVSYCAPDIGGLAVVLPAVWNLTAYTGEATVTGPPYRIDIGGQTFRVSRSRLWPMTPRRLVSASGHGSLVDAAFIAFAGFAAGAVVMCGLMLLCRKWPRVVYALLATRPLSVRARSILPQSLSMPAVEGACAVFTQNGVAFDVCISQRIDVLTMTRKYTGVPCSTEVALRLECDRDKNALPSCDKLPWYGVSNPEGVDFMSQAYPMCAARTHYGSTPCGDAAYPHSWCFTTQWARCYTYLRARQLNGTHVESWAVSGVVTGLQVSVNGTAHTLQKGQSADIGGVTVEYTSDTLERDVPEVIWRYKDQWYAPREAYHLYGLSGPFTCVLDGRGLFKYDEQMFVVTAQSTQQSVAPVPPGDYIGTTGLTPLLADELHGGCKLSNNTTPLHLTGCARGSVNLRFLPLLHTLTLKSARVSSVEMSESRCLTTSTAASLTLLISAARAGLAVIDSGGACTPRTAALTYGSNHVHLVCTAQEMLPLTIANVSVTVPLRCDEPEGLMSVMFRLVPHVSDVSDGMPDLPKSIVDAFLQKYMWLLVSAGSAMLALIVLPLVIKAVKLLVHFVDRSQRAAYDPIKKFP